MRVGTDRQTQTHTHTHRQPWPIHFASATPHAKCNQSVQNTGQLTDDSVAFQTDNTGCAPASIISYDINTKPHSLHESATSCKWRRAQDRHPLPTTVSLHSMECIPRTHFQWFLDNMKHGKQTALDCVMLANACPYYKDATQITSAFRTSPSKVPQVRLHQA